MRVRTTLLVVATSTLVGSSARGEESEPRAYVHIESPTEVELRAGDAAVCRAPCDEWLGLGLDYGLRLPAYGSTTHGVRLRAPPGGGLTIDVRPPSRAGTVAGGFVAGAGALAVVGGGVAALWGHVLHQSGSSDSSRDDGATLRTGGLVSLGVGAGLAVIGLVVLVVSGSTDIEQRPWPRR